MPKTLVKVTLLTVLVILLVLPSVTVVLSSAANKQSVSNSTNDTHNSKKHGSFTCPVISGADSSTCSTNWSGYADNAGPVTNVSGSWTVPTLSCPSSGSTYVAIWVGIDGYSSSTVEQTGVLGQCSSGKASYSAWYEFYPSASVTISGFSVSPGDNVTANVSYSGGVFTTTIKDLTTGATFSTTGTVSNAARSSAEWIVERPALCSIFRCSLSTLSNFGSTSFTSASATIGGATGSISAFSDVAITMVGSSSGPVLAEPSSLSTDGTSFSVAYG
ncbi:MAG: G1 family endopeptidase [archaeon]|nr:G1 family endopeptidase [archaeon]